MLFFFNDTATTEIYTLSLHDALPICEFVLASYLVPQLGRRAGVLSDAATRASVERAVADMERDLWRLPLTSWRADRKSTRLNSSHANISYAVFCLKKKKTISVPHHPA